jgi:hypothetical protein
VTRRDALVGSTKLALGGALGVAVAGRLAARALAQATPAAPDLSPYPELTITVTDQAVQLSPPTIPSGFVLVTVVNQMGASGSSQGFSIVGPPAGMGFADFLAQLKPTAPSGTPGAGGGGLPPIAYTATIVGGPGNIDPGQTGRAIVDLPAGQWVIPHGQGRGISLLTATPGTPGATRAPTAAVTITEVDFGFAGFDHVAAGPQVWRVVHHGTQPHLLDLFQVPAGTTVDQVVQLIALPDNATPPPGLPNPSDFRDRGGVSLQSQGTTVWPVLDLPAGRYAAACFVPDPSKGGEPHALEGMTSVFDVG